MITFLKQLRNQTSIGNLVSNLHPYYTPDNVFAKYRIFRNSNNCCTESSFKSARSEAMAVSPNKATSSKHVKVPNYANSDLSTGIIHFGIGNFARSHQMSYMEDLLKEDFENSKGWAYTGVGVRHSATQKKKDLGSQGLRFSVVQSNGSGSKQEVQVIGALRDILVGPDDSPGEILKVFSADTTRIATMTITEQGYTTPLSKEDKLLFKLIGGAAEGSITREEAVGRFDDANANASKYNGGTVMGYIATGLAARRATGIGGITLLSCDNIPQNGDNLRAKLMAKVEELDKGLCSWVEKKCTFPNCMVDSITPSTTDELKEELAERHGIQDSAPVPREFFKQWVIEDNFVAGRPAWEKVGAQLVKDVTPFELTKIRMLNINHTVMGLPGILKGLSDTPAAAKDEDISKLYKSVIKHELKPVLEKIPGLTSKVNLEEYQEKLENRFVHGLPDVLTRIAEDTSEKMTVQGVPAILEGFEADLPMHGMALTVASWAHYIKMVGEGKASEKKLQDPRGDELVELMKGGKNGVDKLLDNKEIFQELSDNDKWRSMVNAAYKEVEDNGIESAIKSVCMHHHESEE